MDLTKFDLLETRVLAILEKLKEREKEAAALNEQLGKLKETLGLAEGQVKALNDERLAILKKLDELLVRLE
jgi:flagellar biosynthesis chaperone FliJ